MLNSAGIGVSVKKVIMVRLMKGGGLMEKKFDRETKFNCLYEELKKVYFPCGKRKIGILSLCKPDLTEISSLDITINQYMEINALINMQISYVH